MVDGLNTIQTGGDDPFTGAFFVVLFEEYIVPVIAVVIVLYLIAGAPSESKDRENQHKARELPVYHNGTEITFHNVTGRYFPSYEGEVQVLVGKGKPVDGINVGEIEIKGKATREELLERMKSEAAYYGADTLILFTDEPWKSESGDLFWRAWAQRIPKKQVK